jgi:type II secretory pathway component PulF
VLSFRAAWDALDSARHRSEFYRLWLAGQTAGFTVPKSLDVMGTRESRTVEGTRCALLAGVKNGRTVSELAQAPGAFESFERSLLVLGDESGSLEKSLRLLADFYSRKHSLMLAVRKQMAYPLFTGVCATFIAPFPLLFFGHTRPYLATVTLGLLAWAAAGGAIVRAVANAYGRRPPMIRARLARSLATAIEAGLPLGRAIHLAGDASADDDVARFLRAIPEVRLSSQSVVQTFSRCPHMTPEFIGALTVADTTGDYSSSLTRLAELYEDGFR